MTRALIRLSGNDTHDFLQGLVTNDVAKVKDGPVYAALLTPQGKFLADFFMIAESDISIRLDVEQSLCDGLIQRLKMYKLRADVSVEPIEGLHLHRGIGDAPSDGWADPRHDALGWRAWRDHAPTGDDVDWDALRIAHMVPATGIELVADSFILEQNFEPLNGVDFRKGCYVGQEVTARMKHKTDLRKGLARVTVQGIAHTGDEITRDGKPVGQLLTRSGDHALAYLRFDSASGEMQCGDATVTKA